MPAASVVVVSWNTRALLADCLASIVETAGPIATDVVVVDNASSDGSAAMVHARFPAVRVIENPTNVGYGQACNIGVAAARTPVVLLLNSDARLSPGALAALLDVVHRAPRAGVVGAQLRNADGSFQASHAAFPTLWREFLVLSGLGRLLCGAAYPSHGPEDERGARPVGYVGGACLLVRRDAYAAVGGFDAGYFMYAEEVDLCYAMQRCGWEVWYQPAARVVHLGGASSAGRRTAAEGELYRGRVRFFRKHRGGTAARLLVWQLYGITAAKHCIHGTLRGLSGGRYGRPVIPLRDLHAKLRQA